MPRAEQRMNAENPLDFPISPNVTWINMHKFASLDLVNVSGLCERTFPPAATTAGTKDGGEIIYRVCDRARCKMLRHGSCLHSFFEIRIGKIAFVK